MIKIGLTGKSRSGKDAVGEYLWRSYDFDRFAFATALKNLCESLYPDQMRQGKKNRALLQGVGEALRQFDEELWIKKALNSVELMSQLGYAKNVVITDVRLPIEVERLKAEGFMIIRVNCDDEIRRQRMIEAGDVFSDEDLTHETEQYIDSFDVDYEIYNSGKLTDTYQQIGYIIDDIQRRQAKRAKEAVEWANLWDE